MLHEKVLASTNKTLDWSLKPLLKFMQIIFALPPATSKSGKLVSSVCLICRYIAWLITVFLHSFLLFIFFHWGNFTFFSTSRKKGFGVTFSWVLLINSGSKAIHSIGIHSILLFSIHKMWTTLYESLQVTENHFKFQRTQYYSTFWKLSVAGVIYIIISVRFKVT